MWLSCVSLSFLNLMVIVWLPRGMSLFGAIRWWIVLESFGIVWISTWEGSKLSCVCNFSVGLSLLQSKEEDSISGWSVLPNELWLFVKTILITINVFGKLSPLLYVWNLGLYKILPIYNILFPFNIICFYHVHSFLNYLQIAKWLNLININIALLGFSLSVVGLHDIHSQHFFKRIIFSNVVTITFNYNLKWEFYLKMKHVPHSTGFKLSGFIHSFVHSTGALKF